MAVVTTSIVVNFDNGGDDDAIFTVEVDDREDGLNGGKTNFLPGDDVYLLLFKTSNVQVDGVITSLGNAYTSGNTTKDIDQFDDFVNEREVSLSYPVSSGFSYDWLGNDLGSINVLNESRMQLAQDKTTLGDPFVGVTKTTYTSNAMIYRLTNTLLQGYDEYQIVVYFYGQTV